jgi:type I restriction enzyme S subunit
MILVTCSGMNLGSVIWTRSDMSGLIATHDLIRVCPDGEVIRPGYLYAFLSSRYGHAWIRKQIYGGNIKHIEPAHIETMPVPRFSEAVETRVDDLVQAAAIRCAASNQRVSEATGVYFKAVGLRDITAEEWHADGPDLGFAVRSPGSRTLRALNFNPRLRALTAKLTSVPHAMLGQLVAPGTLQRGNRFTRIDADAEHGVQLVGQRQLFWLFPRGRSVAKWALKDDVMVRPGTILVAARGTLGETELYCRGEFIWGRAADRAYSEDFLRVIPDVERMPAGCLFAFLRSETAFRLLRSISSGSKQQDHHRDLREKIPVPVPSDEAAAEVHRLVVDAYDGRERGLEAFDEATALVEQSIEEAGRWQK